MAWSFRKKIKIAPGVNLNLSKSGVSTSVGPKGAKINVGPKGTTLHTSIPGTGIYYREKLSGDSSMQGGVNESSSPHYSPKSSWIDVRGKGSLIYGCLGSWPRFLIWVGVLILLYCLFDGISIAKLDWWQVSLYTSLVVGALLLLWRLNGGNLHTQPEKRRFKIILWMSLAAISVLAISKFAYTHLLIGCILTLLIIGVLLIYSFVSR